MNSGETNKNSEGKEDLFKWGGVVVPKIETKKPIVSEEKKIEHIEYEYDETDTCPMCKNGGFCAKHTSRTNSKDLVKMISLKEVNKELQSISKIPKSEEPLSDEEIQEELRKIRDKLNKD